MSSTNRLEGRTAEINAAIGQRVAELRKARGMSQAALAAAVTDLGGEMHQTYVSGLEKGRSRWNIEMLVFVSAALGVEFTDLIPGAAQSSLSPLEQALLATWRAGGAKAVISLMIPHLPD